LEPKRVRTGPKQKKKTLKEKIRTSAPSFYQIQSYFPKRKSGRNTVIAVTEGEKFGTSKSKQKTKQITHTRTPPCAQIYKLHETHRPSQSTIHLLVPETEIRNGQAASISRRGVKQHLLKSKPKFDHTDWTQVDNKKVTKNQAHKVFEY
jgi:hypothetical protein